MSNVIDITNLHDADAAADSIRVEARRLEKAFRGAKHDSPIILRIVDLRRIAQAIDPVEDQYKGDIYAVFGVPKDGDMSNGLGDVRFVGREDDCESYAERNASPDNAERYDVRLVHTI